MASFLFSAPTSTYEHTEKKVGNLVGCVLSMHPEHPRSHPLHQDGVGCGYSRLAAIFHPSFHLLLLCKCECMYECVSECVHGCMYECVHEFLHV